jgi:hypothetical protein
MIETRRIPFAVRLIESKYNVSLQEYCDVLPGNAEAQLIKHTLSY